MSAGFVIQQQQKKFRTLVEALKAFKIIYNTLDPKKFNNLFAK